MKIKLSVEFILASLLHHHQRLEALPAFLRRESLFMSVLFSEVPGVFVLSLEISQQFGLLLKHIAFNFGPNSIAAICGECTLTVVHPLN
jgi:hypothetical protein